MKRVTSVVAMLSAGGLLVAACGGGDSGGGAGGSGNAGAADGGGAGGSSATGGSGGSGGGTVDCASDAQCVAKMPATDPPDCAEAKCDLVLKKCNFVAKDADGDGHTAAKCLATGEGVIDSGDDCDDGDATSYPGAWDGPADGGQSDRCDSKDQDCDGNADDGKAASGKTCACDPLKPPACNEDVQGKPISGLDGTKDGVGACKLGTRECNAGVPGKCLGAAGPSGEVCDGQDNDCDGKVDQGDPGGGVGCNTGLKGNCGPGTTSCEAGKVKCNATQQASPEKCDNQDNDCNGTVDDTKGDACDTKLKGICAAGTVSCDGNGAFICEQKYLKATEIICNGVDEDCNGTADDVKEDCGPQAKSGDANCNGVLGDGPGCIELVHVLAPEQGGCSPTQFMLTKWLGEGNWFPYSKLYMFTNDAPGLIPIRRCLNTSTSERYIRWDKACDASHMEEGKWWVSSSPATGYKPVKVATFASPPQAPFAEGSGLDNYWCVAKTCGGGCKAPPITAYVPPGPW